MQAWFVKVIFRRWKILIEVAGLFLDGSCVYVYRTSKPWFNGGVSFFSGGNRNLFICQKCGRTYRVKRSLARHMRFECGVEPQFPCSFCPYRAYQAVHLRHHMLNNHRDASKDAPEIPSVRRTRHSLFESSDANVWIFLLAAKLVFDVYSVIRLGFSAAPHPEKRNRGYGIRKMQMKSCTCF